MKKPVFLGISGSLRRGSTNRKLLREAVRLYGDADYTEADICFPLYDGDIESGPGIPDSVHRLVGQIAAADAVLISGPEYNGSISGVLKNALDWISRVERKPLIGMPTVLLSAAAGRAGGARSQFAMRLCLVAFRPQIVIGPEVALADSRNQFDEDGWLKNERTVKSLTGLMQALRQQIKDQVNGT